jgi:hypothetical protein
MPVGVAIDIAEGPAPAAPNGVTRIARVGGVLVQSTDGANYVPLSTPMTPTAPGSSGGRAGTAIDIAEGAVGPSRNGVTRIARTGGALVQSTDGANYAPLSSAMSPTAPGSSGFGPVGGAIDIAEGPAGPSVLGVTRIARIGGVLMVSIDGAPYAPLAGVVPPGTPSLWFDGQNIDGLNNSSLVDGQQLGTWLNLGSLGAGGNLVQATGATKPLFRLVAAAGKINNKSGVENTGTMQMSTLALTSQPQPNMVAFLYRQTALANGQLWDASTGGGRQFNQMLIAGPGTIQMFAGAGPVPTTAAIATGTWETVVNAFNGVSSYVRLNGVQTANVNPGTNALDSLRIFTDVSAVAPITGIIVELLEYSGGSQPTAAQIEAYFTSKYGATPQ